MSVTEIQVLSVLGWCFIAGALNGAFVVWRHHWIRRSHDSIAETFILYSLIGFVASIILVFAGACMFFAVGTMLGMV